MDDGTKEAVAVIAEQVAVKLREEFAAMAEAIADDVARRYVEGDLMAAGARMVAKAIRGES